MRARAKPIHNLNRWQCPARLRDCIVRDGNERVKNAIEGGARRREFYACPLGIFKYRFHVGFFIGAF
jgi:hypothetical protein